MRVAAEIVLTDKERAELARRVRSKRTSVLLAQRAGRVLLAADGMQNKDIAAQLGVGRVQVARWRERYEQSRFAGIERDEHALVLCCDEKSQIQALDRTQPGLPLKKARAATLTHDYKRNGTTTPFAALNVLDGSVIAQCNRVTAIPSGSSSCARSSARRPRTKYCI